MSNDQARNSGTAYVDAGEGVGYVPMHSRAGIVGWAKVDPADLERIAAHRWNLDRICRQPVTSVAHGGGRTGTTMGRIVLEIPPGTSGNVKYLNGDRTDCRRKNLRPPARSTHPATSRPATDAEPQTQEGAHVGPDGVGYIPLRKAHGKPLAWVAVDAEDFERLKGYRYYWVNGYPARYDCGTTVRLAREDVLGLTTGDSRRVWHLNGKLDVRKQHLELTSSKSTAAAGDSSSTGVTEFLSWALRQGGETAVRAAECMVNEALEAAA